MLSAPFVLGIDGGGTKTLALLADRSGTTIGSGTAGTSNYHRVGIENAFAALDSAMERAFQSTQSSLSKENLAAACLGLAGVDRPADRALVEQWLSTRLPGIPARLTNDALPVLAAGTPQGWGLAVISGTGSIAYSMSPDGSLKRAGGWGYIFGDEGSAYSIGLAALRSAAQFADGRAPLTALLERILQHWQLSQPADLVNKVYSESTGRENIAQLAILVSRAAGDGDSAALEILNQAGSELARMAFAAAQQFDLAQTIPCALAGSVLIHNPIVVSAFIRHTTQTGLHLSPVQSVPEPAAGCLKLAAQLISLSV